MIELARRALGKLFRWASQPPPLKFATVGPHVAIHPPFSAPHADRLFLGDWVHIGAYCAFNAAGGIRVGDGTAIGPWVHIYSANHRYDAAEALPFDDREYGRPVDIGPYVWIGGDCIIVPGVTVGEGAVIAAGSVVVHDVPPGAIVGGCPARVLKQRDMDHYAELKRQKKAVFAIWGFPGHYAPRFSGAIPPHWYTDAGLPVPPPARTEDKAGH